MRPRFHGPFRPRRLAFLAVGLAIGAVISVFQSGGAMIDHTSAERLAHRALSDWRVGPATASVRCPTGVPSKPHTSFNCRIGYPDGSTLLLTMHITGTDGQTYTQVTDLHQAGGSLTRTSRGVADPNQPGGR
jgi:hypothetical protein